MAWEERLIKSAEFYSLVLCACIKMEMNNKWLIDYLNSETSEWDVIFEMVSVKWKNVKFFFKCCMRN